MGNIVKQDYWNQQYKTVLFSQIAANSYLRAYISRYIPPNEAGKAIEIGCYPCRFLSLFGELGYELNGVDMNPDTDLLNEVVKAHGFKVGAILCGDFLKLEENTKYDVVSSFGFVEHFTNLEELIVKHANIVAPGGYLILETPNFDGWGQHLFHSLFDTPNLRRHVRGNMNPERWKKILIDKGFAFDYLCCDYCGGIDFWTDKDQSILQNFFAKIVKRLWFGLKWALPFVPFSRMNSKAMSRSCILIAKKQ